MQGLQNLKNEWSLFLDRDGVINERIMDGYIQTPSEFVFLPGSLEAFPLFSSIFKYIFIITNQQGIGKGIMNIDELEKIHQYMIHQIKLAGGRIDGIYFCPDLATQIPNCRKPGIAMALHAQKDFPDVDFSKSFMVGDTIADMEFGKNAGMQSVLIQSNQAILENEFQIFASLYQFAHTLKSY
jgi:histidinol-phosphate phosphatase family protein